MVDRSEPAYDLFVSYAPADRAWVEGYLLDALSAADLAYQSEEAFALGRPRLAEFERAIKASKRTLLVLSPAYLAGEFRQFADLLAQSYSLETTTWSVIPLILHPVQLPTRLSMLTPLDATDPENHGYIVERLCAELRRHVPAFAPKPPCPYPGMRAFTEADSALFYGREAEIEAMMRLLRKYPFLTVIGPSGSGKSSLVFAGLLPKLRETSWFGQEEWSVKTIRPGSTPLTTLRSMSLGDEHPPDGADVLLIVDQFEETYTLGSIEAKPFQDALLRLIGAPGMYVILTIRADFYPDLMASVLWPEVRAHRLEIMPLDAEELRQAIVCPAENSDVFIDPALVERLLADASGEPGILPFVQETLVLMWSKLERRFLSIRAYESLVDGDRAGKRTGLQVAMAEHADYTFRTLCSRSPEAEPIVRRIFLRMIQFGQGRADTRRQQTVSALCAAGEDPRLFAQTLRYLADQRLLTMGGEEKYPDRKVDIAHEALITGWPTLQQWLDERREAELTRRRLQSKAEEWKRLERQAGKLDEIELIEAEEWLTSPYALDLGVGETLVALTQFSRQEIERAAREREEARQRELAQAQELAEARQQDLVQARELAEEQQQRAKLQSQTTAKLRRGALFLGGALILALVAIAFAVVLGLRAAEQARDARTALSIQLAVQSQSALERFPQRSLLLAIEAFGVATRAGDDPVPDALDALQQALANSGGRGLSGHTGPINALAISANGRWLVSGSKDATAMVWDLSRRDLITGSIVLRGHQASVTDVAIGVDGRWLATGSEDGTARLWSVQALANAVEPSAVLDHGAKVNAVALSPDGRWLATSSPVAPIRLWDLDGPGPGIGSRKLSASSAGTNALATSVDGRWLVVGGSDGIVRVWSLVSETPEQDLVLVSDRGSPVLCVAISEDMSWIAAGHQDGTLRLWPLRGAELASEVLSWKGHGGPVWAMAISEDAQWLATSSATSMGEPGDNAVRLWDLSSSDPSSSGRLLAQSSLSIWDVLFSADSRWLSAGGGDKTIRLWDLAGLEADIRPLVLRGHEASVSALAVSADGAWLATGSWDNTIRLWKVTELGQDLAALGPDALVDLACRTAGRNMTRAEWQQCFGEQPYRKTCEQWSSGGG